MLEVKKLGVILEPTTLSFETAGVFNPAVFQQDKTIHLFYRALDEEHKSCIGYARLDGPLNVVERWQKPLINREFSYEQHGVEDPEITKLGNLFYFFYVAYDGKNAVTAYATSKDLKTFKKMGVVTPQITYRETEELIKNSQVKDAYFGFTSLYQKGSGEDVLLWDKDISLFPKKINGKFALLHRILPDIQIVFFNDFRELTIEFWRDYLKNLSKYIVLENKYWFESRNIGAGCPPIETKDGWLLIFHTVEEINENRIYRASAVLLDKENPLRVIGRLKTPLFSPTENWEIAEPTPSEDKPLPPDWTPELSVVFPTGTALFGETLYIYYGAADKLTAVASVNLNELLKELKKS